MFKTYEPRDNKNKPMKLKDHIWIYFVKFKYGPKNKDYGRKVFGVRFT